MICQIHDLMLAAYPVDNNHLLFPSGIKIKLKQDADHNPEEIFLLTESGEPLDIYKTYSVAMNIYMTSVYKYKHNDPGRSLFITSADATIGYLKKIQKIRSYRGEKRIQID